MALLAKLDDLKDLIGTSETTSDELLTTLLERASQVAEDLARRPLRRQVDRVEYPVQYPDYCKQVTLTMYPVESITAIRYAGIVTAVADFASIDALVEDTDFTVDSETGIVRSIYGPWIVGHRCMQVTYTAGYIDPATESIPAGAILPPDSLQQGVLYEALQNWNYRNSGGVEEVNLANGGSYRAPGIKTHAKLTEAVEALTRRYML